MWRERERERFRRGSREEAQAPKSFRRRVLPESGHGLWLSGRSCAAVPLDSYRAQPHTHAPGTAAAGHGSRAELEHAAVAAEGPERPYRRLVEALKMVLLDKGLITLDCLR